MVIEEHFSDGEFKYHKLADNSAIAVDIDSDIGVGIGYRMDLGEFRCPICINADDHITAFNVPDGSKPEIGQCARCGKEINVDINTSPSGTVAHVRGGDA